MGVNLDEVGFSSLGWQPQKEKGKIDERGVFIISKTYLLLKKRAEVASLYSLSIQQETVFIIVIIVGVVVVVVVVGGGGGTVKFE